MITEAQAPAIDLPPDPECLILTTEASNCPTFLKHLKVSNCPIQPWSHYYIRLGITLSRLIESDSSPEDLTLNLAISAPTRQYASTFINLGIQIGMRSRIIDYFDKSAYFSEIKSTPVDSEIRYYEKPQLNGNSKKCIFKGTEVDERGVEWVLLQDKKNTSTTNRVNAARSYCVLKDGLQGVKTLKSIIQFLKSAGQDKANIEDAIAYTYSSCANIAVVGQANTLAEENALSIGIEQGGATSELSLKDITRLGTQTLLLSSMRDETIEQLETTQPPIVIYESISAENKYGAAYSPRIRVYLVDRSTRSSRDYRASIEEHYLCRESIVAPVIPANIPGVETLTFYTY